MNRLKNQAQSNEWLVEHTFLISQWELLKAPFWFFIKGRRVHQRRRYGVFVRRYTMEIQNLPFHVFRSGKLIYREQRNNRFIFKLWIFQSQEWSNLGKLLLLVIPLADYFSWHRVYELHGTTLEKYFPEDSNPFWTWSGRHQRQGYMECSRCRSLSVSTFWGASSLLEYVHLQKSLFLVQTNPFQLQNVWTVELSFRPTSSSDRCCHPFFFLPTQVRKRWTNPDAEISWKMREK